MLPRIDVAARPNRSLEGQAAHCLVAKLGNCSTVGETSFNLGAGDRFDGPPFGYLMALVELAVDEDKNPADAPRVCAAAADAAVRSLIRHDRLGVDLQHVGGDRSSADELAAAIDAAYASLDGFTTPDDAGVSRRVSLTLALLRDRDLLIAQSGVGGAVRFRGERATLVSPPNGDRSDRANPTTAGGRIDVGETVVVASASLLERLVTADDASPPRPQETAADYAARLVAGGLRPELAAAIVLRLDDRPPDAQLEAAESEELRDSSNNHLTESPRGPQAAVATLPETP